MAFKARRFSIQRAKHRKKQGHLNEMCARRMSQKISASRPQSCKYCTASCGGILGKTWVDFEARGFNSTGQAVKKGKAIFRKQRPWNYIPGTLCLMASVDVSRRFTSITSLTPGSRMSKLCMARRRCAIPHGRPDADRLLISTTDQVLSEQINIHAFCH